MDMDKGDDDGLGYSARGNMMVEAPTVVSFYERLVWLLCKDTIDGDIGFITRVSEDCRPVDPFYIHNIIHNIPAVQVIEILGVSGTENILGLYNTMALHDADGLSEVVIV